MAGTLLVQFPPTSHTTLERVHEVEDALITAMDESGGGEVDGHDFGEYSNIFIFPEDQWEPALSATMKCLDRIGALDEVLVIKRSESEEYEVVHPPDFAGEFERC
jgi:hypothetical protein